MKRPTSKTLEGTQYIGTWKNSKIPVYDVLDKNGLNSIIGYVKHLNGESTVLYRGQCTLYENLLPSILRDKNNISRNRAKLNRSIDNLYNDEELNFSMDWDDDIKGWELYIKTTYEAALQHYGAKTYCMDFVDNHWTALWFALNEYDSLIQSYKKRSDNHIVDNTWIDKNPYFTPSRKFQSIKEKGKEIVDKYGSMSEKELRKNISKSDFDKVQNYIETYFKQEKQLLNREKHACAYIFLYYSETYDPEVRGLYLGKSTFVVDLRKALPGIYLRPSSQHGWIVKGRKEDYDYKQDILCVLRLSIPLIDTLLGNGELLSQENFFPSPEVDGGYRLLLRRQENSVYFNKSQKALLGENMILPPITNKK